MSKKRKTRKQKESAHARHTEQVQHSLQTPHIHIESPTYSVTNLKTEKIVAPVASKPQDTTIAQKDMAYLKHDISAITAASGIVAAFDILLFVLLGSGFLHLHFLGY